MTSVLYVVLCGAVAALAAYELKTRNRAARIQAYITVLGALAFCGLFALLVTGAQASGGAYQPFAAFGVLLLTGGSLLVVTRVSRGFRNGPLPRHRRS